MARRSGRPPAGARCGGMRKADVAIGACVRLAATVSLILAAAKIRDHVDDGDGAFGRPGVRGAATARAARWAAASARTGGELGFEVGVLTDAIGRQTAVEAAAGPGTALLTVTEPTETAPGTPCSPPVPASPKPGACATTHWWASSSPSARRSSPTRGSCTRSWPANWRGQCTGCSAGRPGTPRPPPSPTGTCPPPVRTGSRSRARAPS